MKKLVLGVGLATVAMFVWGAVFWMNPLTHRCLDRSPDDAAAGRALLDHFPRTGTYVVPSASLDPARLESLHRAGPLATVHIQREGAPPMSLRVLALGFLHEFVTVALLAGLLRLVLPALPGFARRFGFIALIGFVSAFYSNLSMTLWWYHPWPFYLVSTVYDVGAWALAGLVLAAFVKPAGGAAPVSQPA